MLPLDIDALNAILLFAFIAALIVSIVKLKFKALLQLIGGVTLIVVSLWVLKPDGPLKFLGKMGGLIELAAFIGLFIAGVTIIICGIARTFD